MLTRRSTVGIVLSLMLSLAPAAAAQASLPSVFVVGDSHVEMVGPMLTARLDEVGFRALGYEAGRGWATRRYREAGDLRSLL